VQYQSEAYAASYETIVREVLANESTRAPNGGQAFVKAVARSLYKLMAYKDEYEVARQYTNGAFAEYVSTLFEGDFKLNFHLAPPLLARRDKVTGTPRKMRFPGVTRWLFSLLAPFKFLRGTKLDPFGYLPERREERQTLAEWQAFLLEVSRELDAENYDSAVELARLPMKIRGFGHVKTENLASVNERKALLLRQFRGEVIVLASEVDVAA
jgi:indolepyruvate ferredoxin oxidoreductase